MAQYLFDPRGIAIIRPDRFTLDKGARLIRGDNDRVDKDDVFTFTEAKLPKVVVGMQGSNTFNAAATMQEVESRYYAWLDKKHHNLLFPEIKWEPWKNKVDIAHFGGDHDFKGGIGNDIGVLHGGRYTKAAEMWMQKGDRLNVAADLADIDLIRFKTGPAERDSDGVGYTAPIQTLYFRGDNPDNPITDDQLFNLHFTDQGTYYKLNSHGDPVNIYKEVMVDFSSLKVGPTEHDIMNVADNFLF